MPRQTAASLGVSVIGRQPSAVWPTLLAMAVLAGSVAYGLTRSRGPAMLNNVAFAAVHLAILLVGVSAAFHVAGGAVEETAGADADVAELTEVGRR